MRSAVVILVASCWLAACARPPESFDVVLKSGRVIDPETNLDGVRDVGIRGDTIARISTEPLIGARTIDAHALVVAPGFIDLHQHGQSEAAYRLMALDGVTSAFELEVGVPDIRRFIDARRGRSPIHFGATASYLAARVLALDMPLPVSVFGPESTGKTTLARKLARRFGTVCVPEYARAHLEAQGGRLARRDIPLIARGQVASEEALARESNRILVCDTDPLLTKVWSETLFGSCPAGLAKQARARRYDLTLLTDVDVPWVGDSVRYLPKDRRGFFKRCRRELKGAGREPIILKGSWEKRFKTACAAVEGLTQRGARPLT